MRPPEIGKLLEKLGAGEIRRGGGAEVSPLTRERVPSLGLITVGTDYFDWHHTDADTVDKIKPVELRLNIAAMAVMSYVLADMPGPPARSSLSVSVTRLVVCQFPDGKTYCDPFFPQRLRRA